MVLLSLAELFFQSALELIALRICETSVVRVAIGTPSLFFLRLTWFYLCIYSITTIIILLIYPFMLFLLCIIPYFTSTLTPAQPFTHKLKYFLLPKTSFYSSLLALGKLIESNLFHLCGGRENCNY